MKRFCWYRLALIVGLTTATIAAAESPAEHWAWQKRTRPALPTIQNPKSQINNPIDAFILARLEAVGLTLTAPASREQLIRRVTFDLIGLPPTPEEVDAFVRDQSANAWEKVIDRLLASLHYGERWGRHWLDLARYADSNGYEHDEVRPDAWRYRDYVIRSFNADKPYDRFIIEQLAGDEAAPGDRDALIATGFNLLGPDMTDSSDAAQRRHNTLSDMTDTASLAFLGLTVACARCHDHKFEPISQADYYRMLTFFTPAVFRNDLSLASAEATHAHDAGINKYLELTKTLRDEVDSLEGPIRTRLYEAKLAQLSPEAQAAHRLPAERRNGGEQELVAETAVLVEVSTTEIARAMPTADRDRLKNLRQQLKNFDGKKPRPLPVAMGIVDRPGSPAKTHFLERGELAHPTTEVQAGFLAVLLPDGAAVPATITEQANSTGRRLTLANWIASPDNPLTARVIVNRLWLHHFGKGIVVTTSDFGVRGERPTHPELLDWLAEDFVSNGWRLKRMHKLMLMSETYQQSTQTNVKDPENKLFSRMNRLRLEGEAVRDALLAVSGRLNPAMGGPSIVEPAAAETAGKGKAVSADPRDHVRRSVYLFARRNLRHPFLEAFDQPDSNLSCPRRERSTTAPQALALLNAENVTAAAKALADRLEREATTEGQRIERAYRLTLSRPPTGTEKERAKAFLRESPLSELCRALFNGNEFVYLD